MKKIFLLCVVMTLMIQANTSTFQEKKKIEELKKIQKTYKYKLRKKCGYSLAYLAQKHTQEEWEAIYKNGKFPNEVGKVCPEGEGLLSAHELGSLYIFAKEYARESGNYPNS